MSRCFVFIILAFLLAPSSLQAGLAIVQGGKLAVEIVVPAKSATKEGYDALVDAGKWLAECLGGVSRIGMPSPDSPSLVIARADTYPEIAAKAVLSEKSGDDAYAIVTEKNCVYLLGNTETAAQYAVADLLRRIGFRWFAPSPQWWIKPKLETFSLESTIVDRPALIDRRIWYAYGMVDDTKPLLENYKRWAIANRLSIRGVVNTGHSFGNIVRRNQEVFEKNPEFSALLPDGKRDIESPINARKFCYSNKELIKLVIDDRLRLFKELKQKHPETKMVSIEPSDGVGTCHCDRCVALGTSSDRVFHLANAVAKGLREVDPDTMVGLYAYGSHRLPPTIPVEPNVYVQVAMAFNRTGYTLPELVELWSSKVKTIGLREYYGVEAWDWGLPGRARGTKISYHQKWIPYYAKRNVNAINAETNANWGAQALGLYIAAQLMWNPQVETEPLVDEFMQLAYGDVSHTMRSFHEKMESAPTLRSSKLLPLFQDLLSAVEKTEDTQVLARLVDLQAYLIYVAKFREFDRVKGKSIKRDNEYYDVLLPLMNYAWRIRMRDTVHYYALARRLCNGLPVADKRYDFYIGNKEEKPVWMQGEPFSDEEISRLFKETIAALQTDDDPIINFSRFLDLITAPGEDAGPARIHDSDRMAIARFDGDLLGYLVPDGPTKVKLGIVPLTNSVLVSASLNDNRIFERKFEQGLGFQEFEIALPGANEYPITFEGKFELHVPQKTPFVFEASLTHPAPISSSGPFYFYVPKNTTELLFADTSQLALVVPGEGLRHFHATDRLDGNNQFSVKVPEGASRMVWHTDPSTKGEVAMLSVPPLLSFHRGNIFVPREVSDID